MKKAILLSLITLTLTATLRAQDDTTFYNRLYYTCKAWGFVKYFHSELAECSINWDSVLIAKIPEIKEAEDNDTFNDILLEMINAPGETALPNTELPEVPDSLMYNLNVAWFDDELLSTEVKTVLDTIFQRFRPRPHCQVGWAFYNGNPTFDNDDQYHTTTGTYPDEEIRLLALFRYWNMINYFFPYKYIMDQDWDVSLQEVIPLFYKADDAEEYNIAMLKIAKRINDSHAFTWGGVINSIYGTLFPRFIMGFFEGETVIMKVHESQGDILPGDIIRSIDGVDISVLRDSLEQFTWGSNELSVIFYLHNNILRGPAGDFEISVENETGIHNYTLSRSWTSATYNSNMGPSGPIWYDTIVNESCHFGYVDMGRLETGQIATMMDELSGTDAIIFDIRSYPQGTLWTLVNYLFTEPIHIANFTAPSIIYPGTLSWSEETIGSNNSDVYGGQIIILFDVRTISQAEYTIMGLEQHPGSIKIGSTTRAADGNVSTVFLPGNLTTMFTGLGTYYPDYAPTQRIGIVPDIEVWHTLDGIKQEKDEVLEYALNCLLLNEPENSLENLDSPLRAYPNPFDQSINILFHLEQNIPVEIELFDITGQQVKLIYKGDAKKGENTIALNGNDLIPGIYFCTLKTKNEILTTKLIKL